MLPGTTSAREKVVEARNGGLMGMTVDAGGNAVGVVQVCEGQVDGATLIAMLPENTTPEPAKDYRVGEWDANTSITGFSQFRLTKDGSGWFQAFPLRSQKPADRHWIYAWSKDKIWVANGPGFSDRDLKRLRPGQVLIAPPTTGRTEITSLAAFKNTCRGWRPQSQR